MTSEQRQSICLKILSNLLLIFGFVFVVVGFGPVVYDNANYYLKNYLGQYYILSRFTKKNSVNEDKGPKSIFSSLISTKEIALEPANLDFSIVIEKIGLVAPIVANVSVSNNKDYMKALRDGVAHASVSAYPSESPGNTYLFAHSSFDFRLLGKYSRAFNLLGKLKVGDRINVFYEGKDYVYAVVNSEVLPGWNTHPLERRVISPILTLQSCYPPGTTLNRIVVTAELIDVKVANPSTDNTLVPDAATK